MRTAAPALLPLFRSEMQVRLLGLMLLQPERSWTLQELAGALAAPASSVHRELRRAENAGIIRRDASARPHRFRAAPDDPAFEPLAALLGRTVGVEEDLRTALDRRDVQAALIYGSWATGVADQTATSMFWSLAMPSSERFGARCVRSASAPSAIHTARAPSAGRKFCGASHQPLSAKVIPATKATASETARRHCGTETRSAAPTPRPISPIHAPTMPAQTGRTKSNMSSQVASDTERASSLAARNPAATASTASATAKRIDTREAAGRPATASRATRAQASAIA